MKLWPTRYAVVRVSVALIVAAVTLVSAGVSTQIQAQGSGGSGEPIAVLQAAPMTTAQVMAQPEIPALIPISPRREAIIQRGQNPASPAVASTMNGVEVPSSGISADAPPPAASIATSFAGPTFTESGWNPPDTMGVVGSTQILTTLNGRVRVYSKTGVIGALNTTLNTFFNSVRDSKDVVDPRVRYDWTSRRWVVIAINVPRDALGNVLPNNRVLMAVSNSDTITAATIWYYYWFVAGTATLFADYPTLGVDEDALYIGVNQFTSTFFNCDAFVIRKAPMLIGGATGGTRFANLLSSAGGPYTPQGVDQYVTGTNEGYFIGVDSALLGRLTLRRISDPASPAPTISGNLFVTVPTTSSPINVEHLGNTGGVAGRLDGLDNRLINATLKNGVLWTVHQIAVTAAGVASDTDPDRRNAARYYGITNLTTVPTLWGSNTIRYTDAVNARSLWMGSIAANGRGERLLGMSSAGPLHYVNSGAWSDLLSGLGGWTPLSNNVTLAYNPSYDNGLPRGERRWGDYSMTSVDPCDNLSFWTIQETVVPRPGFVGNQWGTQITKLLAAPPGAITSVSPNVIPRHKPNITIVAAAPRLYDPGAGFACRISASVSGVGVTVNSVSYLSLFGSTYAVINLQVALTAPLGPRNLTITNPDGQSTTLVNALTIAPAAKDTVGVRRPANSTFYLRNSLVTGPADITHFLGINSDLPVTGDWNGDGLDTIGIYRPSIGQFFLKDSNTAGSPITYSLVLGGGSLDVPVAGDWNGDGRDSVGIYRPSQGRFYLKNALGAGPVNYVITYGNASYRPIAGDWNGDGIDSPGLYRTFASGAFFLTNTVCAACVPPTNFAFVYGATTDLPVAGDWNGGGVDGIGVYRQATGRFYLRDSLSAGPANYSLVLGGGADLPVAGNWAIVGGVLSPDAETETAPTFEPPR